MMKATAAVLTGPGTYDFIEETVPECGENDVVLKMVSLGLCHSDLPPFAGKSIVCPNKKYGFREPQKPFYPTRIGHEAVARVVKVGRNVKRFSEGDYVTGRMRYSQRTYLHVPDADNIAPTIQLFKIPETDRDIRCCLGEPMECVINMIRETKPEYGDNLAVVGCGFMGLLTIAGLRASGCKKLVAIDINDEKLEIAKQLGAADVLNSAGCENISEWAYEITEGRFFDEVIEVSGSIHGLDTAMKILKYTHENGNAVTRYFGNGRIISSSVYTGEEVIPASLGFNLMLKGTVIQNVHPSYALDTIRNEELGIESFISGVFPMEKLVTHKFSFDKIQDAMQCLITPPEGYIKGIVTFDD